MTSRDFAYWLQGFFEIQDPSSMNASQIETIKKHLSMVFYHEIDPTFGGPEKQVALDALHAKVDEVGKKADRAAQAAREAGRGSLVMKC